MGVILIIVGAILINVGAILQWGDFFFAAPVIFLLFLF